MASRISIETPPTWEPCTLEELREHLRIDPEQDDGVALWGMAQAARIAVEAASGRALPEQGLVLTLDAADPRSSILREYPSDWLGYAHERSWGWPDQGLSATRPGVFELPRPPLQSVQAVNFYPYDGSAPLSPSFAFDATLEPGIVYPPTSSGQEQPWPTTRLRRIGGVRIHYTAGYANADLIPENLKTLIKLVTGALYENREMLAEQAMSELGELCELLLQPSKVDFLA